MAMQPQLITRVNVDEVKRRWRRDCPVALFRRYHQHLSRVVFGAYNKVPASTHRLVFDFAKMEYMNSSGIALIIELLMAANKASRSVTAWTLASFPEGLCDGGSEQIHPSLSGRGSRVRCLCRLTHLVSYGGLRSR